MAFTIKSLCLLLAVTSTLAELGFHYEPQYHEPLHHQTLDEHHHGEEYEMDYHAHPKYSFDYSVKDPHTGDDKEHWETRDGDKVKGTYTLTETDGTKRVVEYEADDKNGFNAVVHKIGTPKEEVHYEPKYEHKFEAPSYHHHNHHEFAASHQNHHELPASHQTHHEFAASHQNHHDFSPSHHEFSQSDDGFVPIVGYEH